MHTFYYIYFLIGYVFGRNYKYKYIFVLFSIVDKNTSDFCLLILYPVNLLN